MIDEFRIEDSYSFVYNGETRMKRIVYFLGEYFNQSPTAQATELSSIHLVDFETAKSMFQYENSKKLLTEAYDYLMHR